jgi:signal peptidase
VNIWKYTKRGLAVVSLVMTVAVLAFVLYVKITGGMLLSIQTGSMQPYLRKGDMTIVRRVTHGQIHKGDVVTFLNPNNPRQTITHRIVETPHILGGETFQTKGDANAKADTPVTASRILGRVDYFIPKLGYAADFIRKPLGLAVVIYAPAAIVVGVEMQKLTQYYRKQQPYVLPARRTLKRLVKN